MNFNGKFWHKPGHLGMSTDEVKKALKALPTPEAGDAGKAVLVNADADGYELGTPGGGGGLTVVGYLNLGNYAVNNFSGSKFFAITPGSGEGSTYQDWFNETYMSVSGPIAFDYVAYLGASNADPTRVAITNILTTSSNLKFKLTNISGSAFNLSDDVTLKFLLLKA